MMMNNEVHSLRQLESIFSSKLCSKIIRNSAQAFYFPFFVQSISFLFDSEAFGLKPLLFFLKFVRLVKRCSCPVKIILCGYLMLGL